MTINFRRLRQGLERVVSLLERASFYEEEQAAVLPFEMAIGKAVSKGFKAQERKLLELLPLLHMEFLEAIFHYNQPIRESVTDAFNPIWDRVEAETSGIMREALKAPLANAARAGAKKPPAGYELLTDMTLELGFPNAEAWASIRGAELVAWIDETTRAQMRQLLLKAVSEGWSYDKTAKAIQTKWASYYEPGSYWDFKAKRPQKHIRSRAHLIAVTEARFAYEHGKRETIDKLGRAGLKYLKAWVTSNDERVTPGCRANQAAGFIQVEAAFPTGHQQPPRFPSCRCCLTYERDKTTEPAPTPAVTLPPAPEPVMPPLNTTAPGEKPKDAAGRERKKTEQQYLDDVIGGVSQVEAQLVTLKAEAAAIGERLMQASGEYSRLFSEYMALVRKLDAIEDSLGLARARMDPEYKALKIVVDKAEALYMAQRRAMEKIDAEFTAKTGQVEKLETGLNANMRKQLRQRVDMWSTEIENTTIMNSLLRKRTLSPDNKLAIKNAIKMVQKRADTAARELDGWLPEVLMARLGGKVWIDPMAERAFYRSGSGVHISINAGEGVVAHELGHWIEDAFSVVDKSGAIKTVKQAAQEYRASRTAGETPQDLGGAMAGEMSLKDKWPDPYSGKVYKDGATEIISMGMEALYDNAAAFLLKDRDYFEFMVRLLYNLA